MYVATPCGLPCLQSGTSPACCWVLPGLCMLVGIRPLCQVLLGGVRVMQDIVVAVRLAPPVYVYVCVQWPMGALFRCSISVQDSPPACPACLAMGWQVSAWVFALAAGALYQYFCCWWIGVLACVCCC